MITNLSSELPEVIQKLHDSKYQFVMTGSRVFGGVTLESDYDFFVKHDDSIDDFLDKLSFYRNHEKEYKDVSIVSIYTREPTFSSNPPIDIQVLSPVMFEAKIAVQNILFKMYGGVRGGLPGDKQFRRVLWDVALAMYQGGQESITKDSLVERSNRLTWILKAFTPATFPSK